MSAWFLDSELSTCSHENLNQLATRYYESLKFSNRATVATVHFI